MSRNRFTAEEIIHKLRETEVLFPQGKKTPEVCQKLGVTDQPYCPLQEEHGGLNVGQAILRQSASGNF